jgi:hypothetical protein
MMLTLDNILGLSFNHHCIAYCVDLEIGMQAPLRQAKGLECV